MGVNILLAPVKKYHTFLFSLGWLSEYHTYSKKYFPKMLTSKRIFYIIMVLIITSFCLSFMLFTNPYVSYRESEKESRQIQRLIQRKEDKQNLNSNVKNKLPDVIIVGVKKSGTMTLARFIKYHPSMQTRGEVHFFERDDYYEKGIEYYRSKMPKASDDQVVLAETPALFQQYDPIRVLKRQRECLPKSKVILIVRDPIVRLVSDIVHYNTTLQKSRQNVYDIDQLIMGNDPDGGRPYYAHLNISTSLRDSVFLLSNYSHLWTQLTTVYPKNQILVLNGDDFTTTPAKVLQKFEKFVGIPNFFTDDHFDFSGKKGYPCFTLDPNGCMSSSKAREHPELKKETMRFLR